MRGNCLDEGILQSYMDGELSRELSAQAAAHISACAACAEALSAAEAESAFFATAFAPDASLAVPTERLRALLDEAIAERNVARRAPRGATIWNLAALTAWLSETFSFAPRHAAAFASLLAIVAFAAIFGVVYLRPGEPNNVAKVVKEEPKSPSVVTADETQAVVGVQGSEPGVEVTNVSAANPPKSDVKTGKKANSNRDERTPNATPMSEGAATQLAVQSVPGEEEYLRAIASLSKVIELSGDAVLNPAYRAEYERNLAVIDRAIEDTRRVAATNPKDTDTTAFLFSAYQKKIDLLSTVADHAQVATLKD